MLIASPYLAKSQHKFTIDLNDISDDQFKVTLIPDELSRQNDIFQFAAIAPGTYSIMDIGRFVRSFTAFDANGDTLNSQQISTNQWKLAFPEKTKRIQYAIAETWDTPVKEHAIYPMSGTSLEEDHAYINNHAVLGYFHGMQAHELWIKIKHPEDWVTGTPLTQNSAGYFTAASYDFAVDSPFILGRLSKATTNVEGTQVDVFTYSKTDLIKSKDILEDLQDILFAASKFTNGTVVGITGSNGKTTTTMLANHILKNADLNVGMGGNIGESFALQIAEKNFDYHVLELSSFQLDGIESFAPHIAILTNITPDHLDRYDYKFENYINSKFRITKNQSINDYLIYDYDDEVIREWLSKNKIKARLVPFSIEVELEQGIFLREDKIIIKQDKTTQEVMSIKTLALQGKHNTKNAMAAAMAASLLKVRNQTIRESLEDFEGAEHRLESVLKVNGVQYINDSKATNVNATYYALDSMESPTVWIVGGVDKGNDYLDLMPLVREKVKAIVCLGLDNKKIVQTFGNVIDLIVETAGAEEAVKVAYKIAEKGDNVLLSPACASFDLFKNYEDRGNKFKKAVRQL